MTVHDPAADRLRTLLRFFARTQCQGRSELYALLSRGVADDDALLAMLLDAPASQRRPSLLLAAVNRLLHDAPAHPLASYYPTHGGDRRPDARTLPAFRAFCDEHREGLRTLLTTRSTQTNEIRRCFALRLGMARLAELWPDRPVALLEIGTSAGLNLAFDAYAYRIGGRTTGPNSGSPVTVSTTARGGGPLDRLLAGPPPVEHRLGADLAPIDLTADPEARLWLEAFVWPEQTHDLATLRAAMDLAVHHRHPVVHADAARDTARLIARTPGDSPVVVFTASLLSYLDADARADFVGQLDAAARTRPVTWLFTEAPALVARARVTAPAPTGPLRDTGDIYAIGLSTHGPGAPRDEVLAVAHPYLEWIAPARTSGDDFQWAINEGLCRASAAPTKAPHDR